MNCKEHRMGTLVLRGMTWSEPRGYAPLVACADLWRAKTGVAVSWERRSLQDFESFSVGELDSATIFSSSTIPMSGRPRARAALRRSTNRSERPTAPG
jgi:hypothetical protein